MKAWPDSYYKVLSPGRVLVDHGPVTMTIEAGSMGQPLTEAAVAGATLVDSLLQALAGVLSEARRAVGGLDPARDSSYPEILGRMVRSVRRLGQPDFTPMAAVAGTFSDMVREEAVKAGADRVVVNNGGDISLYGEGSHFRVGVVSDLGSGVVTHAIDIFPGSGVGGVATSGLGGRSLTRGVASAVTVVAESGSLADAAATSIANAANCEDPGVERCLAEDLDDLTDIRGYLVTLRVAPLTVAGMEEALSGGFERARDLYREGMIRGAVIFVQGRQRMFPEGLARPLF